MTNKDKFSNFEEFWQETKNLSEQERESIFNSFTKIEQVKIKKSYQSGGWEDLFFRNKLDDLLEQFKQDKKLDLISIRLKVLKGKSVFIDKHDWDLSYALLLSTVTDKKHLHYIFGGIEVHQENEKTLLLTDNRSFHDKEKRKAN